MATLGWFSGKKVAAAGAPGKGCTGAQMAHVRLAAGPGRTR
jgi:hypothetical protein